MHFENVCTLFPCRQQQHNQVYKGVSAGFQSDNKKSTPRVKYTVPLRKQPITLQMYYLPIGRPSLPPTAQGKPGSKLLQLKRK